MFGFFKKKELSLRDELINIIDESDYTLAECLSNIDFKISLLEKHYKKLVKELVKETVKKKELRYRKGGKK